MGAIFKFHIYRCISIWLIKLSPTSFTRHVIGGRVDTFKEPLFKVKLFLIQGWCFLIFFSIWLGPYLRTSHFSVVLQLQCFSIDSFYLMPQIVLPRNVILYHFSLRYFSNARSLKRTNLVHSNKCKQITTQKNFFNPKKKFHINLQKNQTKKIFVPVWKKHFSPCWPTWCTQPNKSPSKKTFSHPKKTFLILSFKKQFFKRKKNFFGLVSKNDHVATWRTQPKTFLILSWKPNQVTSYNFLYLLKKLKNMF